jgi:hypothetical protein
MNTKQSQPVARGDYGSVANWRTKIPAIFRGNFGIFYPKLKLSCIYLFIYSFIYLLHDFSWYPERCSGKPYGSALFIYLLIYIFFHSFIYIFIARFLVIPRKMFWETLWFRVIYLFTYLYILSFIYSYIYCTISRDTPKYVLGNPMVPRTPGLELFKLFFLCEKFLTRHSVSLSTKTPDYKREAVGLLYRCSCGDQHRPYIPP